MLFSIPAGGGGVQLDASGSVYIGGATTSVDPFVNIGLPPLAPVPVPPVFSSIPQACVPNYITAISEAYAMKIDPATGAVEDGQWIDGSTPGATGVTLAGGKVWITGATEAPDVPFTPGALAPTNLGPGFLEGAYLSAVDFSGSAAAGPAIACVLDGGNLTHVGAVAAFQLISIFGSHLGPAAGVAAPDGSDPSVAGISVTFDGNPAQVLYVSASQINVDVTAPPPSQAVAALPVTTVMQVNVNGSTVQRQFPFTESNLNIFATLSPNQVSCPGGLVSSGVQPLASNADGSLNSCGNPARYGSTVSLYVHGAGASQLGFPPATQILGVQALVGSVDLSLPGQGQPCDTSSSGQGETYFQVTLSYNGVPAGP